MTLLLYHRRCLETDQYQIGTCWEELDINSEMATGFQMPSTPFAERWNISMITSKKEYLDYLIADRKALGRKQHKPKINDYIWKYEILLRKCEYYYNVRHDMIGRLILLALKVRRSRLGLLCGFEIPLNAIDRGLCLAHKGPVIISEYASVGENCKIHAGVNIGADARVYHAAPQIGNEVYIGPGAKLFGAITIADRIAIGANAVVNKSFDTPGVTIGGIPATIIGNTGSEGILFNRSEDSHTDESVQEQ